MTIPSMTGGAFDGGNDTLSTSLGGDTFDKSTEREVNVYNASTFSTSMIIGAVVVAALLFIRGK